MTAAVFDFRYIAARLERRELVPVCTGCAGSGWERLSVLAIGNPYTAPALVGVRECTVCRNPKGMPKP